MIALSEKDADKIIFYLRRQKEMYMSASKDFLNFINLLGEKKEGEDFINKLKKEWYEKIASGAYRVPRGETVLDEAA